MYTAITRASNVTVVLRDRYAEPSPIQDIKAINELINRNKTGEEISDKEFESVIVGSQKTEKEKEAPKV
jgi:DNA-binding protein